MLDDESSQKIHDNAEIDMQYVSNFMLNVIQIYKRSMEKKK